MSDIRRTNDLSPLAVIPSASAVTPSSAWLLDFPSGWRAQNHRASPKSDRCLLEMKPKGAKCVRDSDPRLGIRDPPQMKNRVQHSTREIEVMSLLYF